MGHSGKYRRLTIKISFMEVRIMLVSAKEMLQKADELGITVLSTEYTMFDACGILYHAGLRGGSRHDA